MESKNTAKYSITCSPEVTDIESFCIECQIFCNDITKDYIWHKEPFILSPIKQHSGVLCLCGSTDFGENVDDEWLIVFLLYKLTERYPDVAAQISDEDGEFLLIQAADKLPRWLKPETCENRIFIHKGSLHIIPQPSNPGEITIYPVQCPTVMQAYNLLISDHKTGVSLDIQNEIRKKIDKYPAKIEEDFHHAHCLLPEEIAYVLHKQPSLIAKAVEAFYERDPIDTKLCTDMKTFQPTNMIMASVKFTKHLYSQLHQAKVLPHRKSKWKLPYPQDISYNATYLGYKLTCGFEILVSRSVTSAVHDTSDFEPCGRQWEQYLTNLKKNEFFQDELEGSKKYLELLKNAKDHFRTNFCSGLKVNESSCLISNLIKESGKDLNEIEKLRSKPLSEEDSDEWLTITSDELDEMLLKDWGVGDESNGACEDKVDNLSKLSSNVKTFVDHVSSHEGVETQTPVETQDPFSEIDFNPDVFMSCLKDMLISGALKDEAGDDDFEDFEIDSDVDDDFVSCFTEGNEDNEITQMMESMDTELKNTNIPKSFGSQNTSNDKNVDDPLDVDVNLVQNFLESFSSQDGLAGPVSTLLNNFGMNLPPDSGK